MHICQDAGKVGKEQTQKETLCLDLPVWLWTAQRRRLSAHPSPECKTCRKCEHWTWIHSVTFTEIDHLCSGSLPRRKTPGMLKYSSRGIWKKGNRPYGAFCWASVLASDEKHPPPAFPAWYLFPAELESLCCPFMSVFMRYLRGKSQENGFLPSSDTNN